MQKCVSSIVTYLFYCDLLCSTHQLQLTKLKIRNIIICPNWIINKLHSSNTSLLFHALQHSPIVLNTHSNTYPLCHALQNFPIVSSTPTLPYCVIHSNTSLLFHPFQHFPIVSPTPSLPYCFIHSNTSLLFHPLQHFPIV